MISDFDNVPALPPVMGPAVQIAYIVVDIDAAMQRWNEEYGVGPFLVTRNAVPLTNAWYRGRKAKTTRVNIAFAYVGDMQLELIELIGDTPGLYKEALDRGLARMSYMENTDSGLILEVIEWNSLTRPYFTVIEKMVKSADAKQLVHEFKLADITPRGAVLLGLVKFGARKMLGRIQQTRRVPTAA